jgi:hypothetical protein
MFPHSISQKKIKFITKTENVYKIFVFIIICGNIYSILYISFPVNSFTKCCQIGFSMRYTQFWSAVLISSRSRAYDGILFLFNSSLD